MKRRQVIRQLFIVGGTVWLFPACMDIKSGGKANLLDEDEQDFLTEIVDTIIPATDTPGAKELGVPLFVAKMISDCQPPDYQKSFKAGLKKLPDYVKSTTGKKWKNLQVAERIKFLQNAAKEEQKEKDIQLCIKAIKELTIKGYTNSEYVMKNLLPYKLVPGHFYGCVPVSDKKSKTIKS